MEISGKYIFIFSVTQQPRSDSGHLIVDVSRSHTIRHTHPVGLSCTSDQLVTDTTTYNTHNKRSRRTLMPSAGFKSAIDRPQTYNLVRMHDWIWWYKFCFNFYSNWIFSSEADKDSLQRPRNCKNHDKKRTIEPNYVCIYVYLCIYIYVFL